MHACMHVVCMLPWKRKLEADCVSARRQTGRQDRATVRLRMSLAMDMLLSIAIARLLLFRHAQGYCMLEAGIVFGRPYNPLSKMSTNECYWVFFPMKRVKNPKKKCSATQASSCTYKLLVYVRTYYYTRDAAQRAELMQRCHRILFLSSKAGI